MNLNLTGNHLEITPAIRDYVVAKLERVTRHFDHVIDVNVVLSVDKLRQLRARGVRISLDDFGTGNSSLNYLTKLPLSQLKIDKSFVDELPASHRDAMVAQTIIAMGQGLELDVIAEGGDPCAA